jgi:biotin-(acetyl-CoA carboxylase) ligase
MTLLLEININQFAHLPVLVSNSVRRVIKRRLGENEKLVKCKWVNDIFVNDKKVSGFLLKGGVIIEER